MGSAIDKNGKTEAEFLREYDVTRYFRPSVTVDALLACPTSAGAKVLLIKRGGHPYINLWAFPGGFVEQLESCEIAACRELCEETGIENVPLRQLLTASTPGRDPRWRNITVVFYALVAAPLAAKGGDDAASADWFDVEYECTGDDAALKLTSGGESFTEKLGIVRDGFGDIDINNTVVSKRGKLAFDHAKILCCLMEKLLGRR